MGRGEHKHLYGGIGIGMRGSKQIVVGCFRRGFRGDNSEHRNGYRAKISRVMAVPDYPCPVLSSESFRGRNISGLLKNTSKVGTSMTVLETILIST